MSVLPYTIIYRGELIQTYRATEFVPGGPDWRIHEVESHRLGWPATAGGTSVPQRAAACCSVLSGSSTASKKWSNNRQQWKNISSIRKNKKIWSKNETIWKIGLWTSVAHQSLLFSWPLSRHENGFCSSSCRNSPIQMKHKVPVSHHNLQPPHDDFPTFRSAPQRYLPRNTVAGPLTFRQRNAGNRSSPIIELTTSDTICHRYHIHSHPMGPLASLGQLKSCRLSFPPSMPRLLPVMSQAIFTQKR